MTDLSNIVWDLTEIGIKLTAEKDVDSLLQLILNECMNITTSDAGSLYIKEVVDDVPSIRFTYTENRSKVFPFSPFVMPINTKSIAGAAAYHGKTYNFKSMDETQDKIGITHNKSFDESYGYNTVNMLVIPMKNYDNEVIGVLQLINKKRAPEIILGQPEDIPNHIVPYTDDEARIVESLAAQAAILIERGLLFQSIEDMIKSFTETLVTALDSRDPITAGHSKRVADYGIALAEDASKSKIGKYRDIELTADEYKELYYAGLLHDVGKIGVREFVLMKENKLLDSEMEAIEYKLKWMHELLSMRKELKEATSKEVDLADKLLDYWDFIKALNQKGFLPDEDKLILDVIAECSVVNDDGIEIPLLTPHEYESLSIKRGTLTDEERKMIQSHALFSFNILSQVNWTPELSRIPLYAASHHEKLNGKGYPKGLLGTDMPLQSRVLAIADIFDALTAKDRPYKPAIPVPKTLAILQEEAEKGHLDDELVQIFIEEKTYERVMNKVEDKEEDQ